MLGWRVTSQHQRGLICEEVPQGGLSFTNPVRVEISLAGAEAGPTHIILKGSNVGFGPIQSNHVKNQLTRLTEAVELTARQPSATSSSQQLEAAEPQAPQAGTPPQMSEEMLAQLHQRVLQNLVQLGLAHGYDYFTVLTYAPVFANLYMQVFRHGLALGAVPAACDVVASQVVMQAIAQAASWSPQGAAAYSRGGSFVSDGQFMAANFSGGGGSVSGVSYDPQGGLVFY